MKLENTEEIRNIGALGEDIACEYLRRNGYMILDRNYDIAEGEIDIICSRLRTVYFCEVKTSVFGDREAINAAVTYETSRPQDRIDSKKRLFVRNTGLHWKFAHQFQGKHAFMDIGVFLVPHETYAVVETRIA